MGKYVSTIKSKMPITSDNLPALPLPTSGNWIDHITGVKLILDSDSHHHSKQPTPPLQTPPAKASEFPKLSVVSAD